MKLSIFLSVLCMVVTALSEDGGPQPYELHLNWPEGPTIDVMGGTEAQIRVSAYVFSKGKNDYEYNITLTLRSPADASDDVLSLLELRGDDILQNDGTSVDLALRGEVNSVLELKVDAFTHGDIKTHAVDLVPVLVSSSVPTSATLSPLHVVIRDNRKLLVGFTGEHGLGSTGNDANTLFVTVGSLDTSVVLAEDLTLLVTLQDTTKGAKGTVKTVTILAGDSGLHKVIFHGIDPTLTYTVTLSATSEYVQIDSPSLILAQSELDKKVGLLDKKLGLLDKKLGLLGMKLEQIKELNQTQIPDNSNSEPEPVEVTTTQSSPTAELVDAVETTATTTAEATTVSKAIQVSVTKPPKPPKPTTVSVEAPAVTTTDMCGDCDEEKRCEKGNKSFINYCIPVNSYFMWWILVTFVIIAVTGYLLFNHRTKVKVYVFGLWKSTDTVQTMSSNSHKYTPLPTSIPTV